MVESIEQNQLKFLDSIPSEYKKEFGQYYTPGALAMFMASLCTKPSSDSVKLLDAGAGVGILSCALVHHLVKLGVTDIEIDLYEVSPEPLNQLRDNLSALKRELSSLNVKLAFNIYNEDFVLSRPDKRQKKYDICCVNPPYFKYKVNTSRYSNVTSDLFTGNPNIYASFLAIILNCLTQNGQLVAISPRSFTNGLYFKGFRQYILSNSSLSRIHLFNSRKDIFKGQSVLQESIIWKITKANQQSNITVSSSISAKDLHLTTLNDYPSEIIIDHATGEHFIRIPKDKASAKVLDYANKLKSRFSDLGFFISTGKVVRHRVKDLLCSQKNKASVPLMKSHNVKPIVSSWDGLNKKDESLLVTNEIQKYTFPPGIYILLKRFTTNEESRRIVAGIINAKNQEHLAVDNQVNVIGTNDLAMDEEILQGLLIFLNSTFFDSYFRVISGNTQVNATEIRAMHFPSPSDLRYLYSRFKTEREVDLNIIDTITDEFLRLQKDDRI